jgi:hypothetical protein
MVRRGSLRGRGKRGPKQRVASLGGVSSRRRVPLVGVLVAMEAGPRMHKHDGRGQRQLLLPACDFRAEWFGSLLTEGVLTKSKE